MALRDMAIVNIERAMRRTSVHPSTSSNNNSNVTEQEPASQQQQQTPPDDNPQPSNEETTTDVAPPVEDDSSPPPQYGEDDIGVTLDYEPPNPDGIVREELGVSGENGASPESRTRRRRSLNSEYDSESGGDGERRGWQGPLGCFRFYSHHWVGQFLSGMFTGLVFFVIGIVFIIYFKELPTYIGVLFILVSLPPCCMAINRWRFARLHQRQRERQINRLNAIRRHRRHHDSEDDVHRDTQLPFSDHPPSYNNLGFVAEDVGMYANPNNANSSVSLSTDVIAPPTYDDVVKYKQMMEEQRLQENSANSPPAVIEVEETQNDSAPTNPPTS